MLALCSMLHPTYYAKNYAGIMGAGLACTHVNTLELPKNTSLRIYRIIGLCVCVCRWVSLAKCQGIGKAMVWFPVWPLWWCCCFSKRILTLLQSIKLCKWGTMLPLKRNVSICLPKKIGILRGVACVLLERIHLYKLGEYSQIEWVPRPFNLFHNRFWDLLGYDNCKSVESSNIRQHICPDSCKFYGQYLKLWMEA